MPRGPKRARGSTVKILCAWKGCRRRNIDVKNKSHVLEIEHVNLTETRKLRSNCGAARFCCAEHLAKCHLPERADRGGREALTAEQCCSLFETFAMEVQAPWAGVAFLLGVFMGERQACVLGARDSWFTGIGTDHPCINVPRINKKTKAREIPLDKSFAALLAQWTSPESGPVRGGGGSQWPHPDQTLQMADQERTGAQKRKRGNLLFPGKLLSGGGRNYRKPVTERGWHDRFQVAQSCIAKQRTAAEAEGRGHVFDEISLARVSSHSMKKSTVTLLKGAGVATKVISLITGTSCRMLENTYFQPSRKVQRDAAAAAFSKITDGLTSLRSRDVNPSSRDVAPALFCTQCGRPAKAAWCYCRSCGSELTDL
ncbi:unnamed protein product [Symbiodinium sp. CCMP2592]|nr:unnamed protein product [Symbiodinium sp. CCMP2592]